MKAMPPEAPRPEEPPPEIRALLREFKQQHMSHWLDENIPALDGLTPREAVARPESRTKLDLLLRDMEFRESLLPAEERFDVDRIREQLGIFR